MDHDTNQGLFIMLLTQRARLHLRANRVLMCAFAYFCESACASARVVKRLRIFLTDSLHFCWDPTNITRSNMGYVVFIFTHHMHARELTSG
jgi:hypothetical protein